MLRNFLLAASAALTLGVSAIGLSAPSAANEVDGGGSAYVYRRHGHDHAYRGWDERDGYRRHGWNGERRGWDGDRWERHRWRGWDDDRWQRHGWRGYEGRGRRTIYAQPQPFWGAPPAPQFWGAPPRPPIEYQSDGYTAY